MSTWIVFLLLGLGVGAMYAALALGVVVVYRGTGVVNFALGAQAMFPAVVYAELRTSGDLLLPVVGIPNRYGIGDPMGFAPAAASAVAVGAVVSVLGYLWVLRPLRDAPPLTQIVATVGLTIVLQGLAVKSFGTATVRTPPILPTGSVDVFGRPVPVDRFWLAGVVLVAALVLALLYRRTRFGVATRAAADHEKGIILLGYDPARLGIINWVLASVFASIIGILVTPLSGVNPFNYSLFVIPALGAALAGRLRSFPTATLTGLAIGSFQALAVHLVVQGHIPDFFQGGIDSLVPFGVIVVVLLRRGHTLPTRGTFLDRHHVDAPMPNLDPRVWGLAIAAALLVAGFSDQTVRLGLIQSLYVATLLLSIVVITGYVGQMSLAQLAFAGFSAFMLAQLSSEWGLPFPLAPVLAIVITTITGTLIGIPALRIRGIQFAIVTFAAALVFERLVFRSPSFTGTGGVAHVEDPTLFGVELGILGNGDFPSRTFAYLMVAGTTVSALLVALVRRSPVGRRFLAVRINERAAAAVGINVARQKLIGAALASFIASVAGVMYGYKSVDLTSAGLEAEAGLEFVGLAFLGGIGTISGAMIGGLIAPSGLVIVAISSGAPSENLFLGTGIGLVLVTLFFPGGIAGLLASALRAAVRPRIRV